MDSLWEYLCLQNLYNTNSLLRDKEKYNLGQCNKNQLFTIIKYMYTLNT